MAEKKAAKPPSKGKATKAAKPAAKKPVKAAVEGADEDASALITQRVRELGDWRGETLARMRALILDAVPGMVEEVKWRKPTNPDGVPVWSYDGIVCTGEVYKDYVKLTFAKGASVEDPTGIFNASLEGNARRAIDIHEGDRVDEKAFQELVRAAVGQNAKRK